MRETRVIICMQGKRCISALPVPHRFGVVSKLSLSDRAGFNHSSDDFETGNGYTALEEYSDPKTERYQRMVEYIGDRLNFTSLKYQALPDMLDAIGLPHEKLCTYCWNGRVGRSAFQM